MTINHQRHEEILEQLRELMKVHDITAEELQFACDYQGYYTEVTPVSEYPTEFIENVLIHEWKGVLVVVEKLRELKRRDVFCGKGKTRRRRQYIAAERMLLYTAPKDHKPDAQAIMNRIHGAGLTVASCAKRMRITGKRLFDLLDGRREILSRDIVAMAKALRLSSAQLNELFTEL